MGANENGSSLLYSSVSKQSRCELKSFFLVTFFKDKIAFVSRLFFVAEVLRQVV